MCSSAPGNLQSQSPRRVDRGHSQGPPKPPLGAPTADIFPCPPRDPALMAHESGDGPSRGYSRVHTHPRPGAPDGGPYWASSSRLPGEADPNSCLPSTPCGMHARESAGILSRRPGMRVWACTLVVWYSTDTVEHHTTNGWWLASRWGRKMASPRIRAAWRGMGPCGEKLHEKTPAEAGQSSAIGKGMRRCRRHG